MDAYNYEQQTAIYSIPDNEHVDPKMHAALEKYRELDEQWHEARSALFAAEDAVATAEAADGEALRAALLDGKTDPGDKHVQNAEKTLRDARRRMHAIHEIWLKVDREVEPLLREQASYTRGLADKALPVALEAVTKATDEAERIVDEAVRKLEDAYALKSLADSLEDKQHGHIGYDTFPVITRTNLADLRADVYQERRRIAARS